jgi:hypothetical protein
VVKGWALFFSSAPPQKERDLTTRRTLYFPALIVATVLVACAAAVLAVSKEAGSTFPDKNGKIAFSSNRHGNPEIYTMNPNGQAVERITHDPKNDSEPAWSPDGNRIAISSDRDGNPSMVEASQDPRSTLEIYTMKANGQASKRITNNHAADFNPDWQPLPPPRQLALQGER